VGEVQYAPGAAQGTPWHRIEGSKPLDHMIDGRFQHQDSHGGGG